MDKIKNIVSITGIIVMCVATFVAVAFLTQVAVGYLSPIKPPATNAAEINVKDTHKFISMCSGLVVTDTTAKLVAMANCLGRMRGFADGHQLSVALQGDAKVIPAMWCIPEGVRDIDILNAILMWTDVNPVRFEQLSQSAPPPTATMMVAVAALHDRFPCN